MYADIIERYSTCNDKVFCLSMLSVLSNILKQENQMTDVDFIALPMSH